MWLWHLRMVRGWRHTRWFWQSPVCCLEVSAFTDLYKVNTKQYLGSFDLQWLCLMLGLVRASKVTLVAIVWLLIVWLHCAFSNVSSKRVHRMMQSHIGCICLTFLRCVFSNVSSNFRQMKMYIHIGYICLISIVSRCGHLLAKYSKQHLEPIEGHINTQK